MNDRPWWRRAVVYQIYPRSFRDSTGDGVGDLRGVVDKLSYVQKLGADVIWLNPIYASPNVDNGYDIADYRVVAPEYGTLADADELITQAHARGLRIILDLVVNHTSDQHEWFRRSCSADPGHYRDYYIWRDGVDGGPPNNWKSSFGGSAWTWNATVGKYYLHLFAAEQPDLNWENPRVRAEVREIMRFWLDRGIDGYRMDVINLIAKNQEFRSTPAGPDGYGSYYPQCANQPRVHEFLRDLRRDVLDDFDVMVVGETPRTTAEQAIEYTDPRNGELDMIFHFEHMHVDRAGDSKWDVCPARMPDLRRVLSHWQEVLNGRGWNSLYWSNHDQPRVVSRFGDDGRFRVESAKMLGTLLHLMQGTPYIYQGEELGMTNADFLRIGQFDDIDSKNAYRDFTAAGLDDGEAMAILHARSRDNARTPMQWTAGAEAGFTDGTPWLPVNPNHVHVNAEEAVEDPQSVFHHYRELIRLRHECDLVTTGSYRLINGDDPDVFAYLREGEGEALLVVCSFSAEAVEFTLPGDVSFGTSRQLLSNYPDDRDPRGFVLRPYEGVVFRLAG
ncbi:glycoside hydrolase family 13 protein [Corynebacterium pacaense]|uniref:glycoside hydrolase family 13 protein n=1 Tax=Corynebacterium pacaense TaxID=1816684 RepID=UPI0009B977C3|nr:alpha-glucosidase [Corynebacterium pacaense]